MIGLIKDNLHESARRRLARFDDADQKYINEVADILRPRDPDLAARLSQDARARLRGWVTAFRIAPPEPIPTGLLNKKRGGDVQIVENALQFESSWGPSTLPMHLTTIGCEGNVQIEVRFVPGWEKLECIGAALNCPTDRDIGGYAVVLRPEFDAKMRSAAFTFGDARANDTNLLIQVLREGRVVRESTVAAKVLPLGPLTLILQRTGDRVLVQLNLMAPVTYQDLFPLPARGVFCLVGSVGRIADVVEGRRQIAAAAATPLERGNDLFLAGEYTAALGFFQKLAVDRAGTPEAHEARFKAAVCLLELTRYDEAAERLRELHEEGVKAWSSLAGCYLVVAHVRRKDLAQAHGVLDRLVLTSNADLTRDLTNSLPDDVRKEILGSYRQTVGGLMLLREDPGRVGKLERLLRAQEALGTRPEYVGWNRLDLIRALRSSSEPSARSEALRRLRGWLTKDYPPGHTATPFGILFAAEYSWLSRELGSYNDALTELDLRMFSAPGVFRLEGYPLLLERARVHVATAEWAKAEKDLTDFLALDPAEARQYRNIAQAHLMLGLLIERRGDAAGAMKAWTGGLSKKLLSDSRIMLDTAGGIALLAALSLKLLTDTLTDDEFEQLILNTAEMFGLQEVLNTAIGKDDFRAAAALMRKSIHKNEARAQLWSFAFQTLPFREYSREPVIFAGAEVIREFAFGGAATPEQDTIVRGLVSTGFAAFTEGRFGIKHAVPLWFTARGARNLFTWGSVEKSLAPELRGPLAYTFGHRYRRLNKSADAISFFRTAVADAPPGSVLKKLAEEELAKLTGKK